MSPSPGTLLKLPKPTTCQSSPTAPNENAAVRLLLLISYNSRAPVPPLQNHIRLGAVIVETRNLPFESDTAHGEGVGDLIILDVVNLEAAIVGVPQHHVGFAEAAEIAKARDPPIQPCRKQRGT